MKMQLITSQFIQQNVLSAFCLPGPVVGVGSEKVKRAHLILSISGYIHYLDSVAHTSPNSPPEEPATGIWSATWEFQREDKSFLFCQTFRFADSY